MKGFNVADLLQNALPVKVIMNTEKVGRNCDSSWAVTNISDILRASITPGYHAGK